MSIELGTKGAIAKRLPITGAQLDALKSETLKALHDASAGGPIELLATALLTKIREVYERGIALGIEIEEMVDSCDEPKWYLAWGHFEPEPMRKALRLWLNQTTGDDDMWRDGEFASADVTKTWVRDLDEERDGCPVVVQCPESEPGATAVTIIDAG